MSRSPAACLSSLSRSVSLFSVTSTIPRKCHCKRRSRLFPSQSIHNISAFSRNDNNNDTASTSSSSSSSSSTHPHPSVIAKEFDTISTQYKLNPQEQFDALESRLPIMKQHNLMTTQRYSLLLYVAFRWGKAQAFRNSPKYKPVHPLVAYNRILSIFDAWMRMHSSSNPDAPDAISNSDEDEYIYNTVTWKLLQSSLGFSNESSSVPFADIRKYLNLIFYNPTTMLTLPQRQTSYYFLLWSLLSSINWKSDRHHHHDPISTKNGDSVESLLSGDAASQLLLIIQIRMEYFQNKSSNYNNGVILSQSSEIDIDERLSKALKVLADRFRQMDQRKYYEKKEEKENTDSATDKTTIIRRGDFRLAVLTIVESWLDNSKIPFHPLIRSFLASLTLKDYPLARSLYLLIRDPVQPLSSFSSSPSSSPPASILYQPKQQSITDHLDRFSQFTTTNHYPSKGKESQSLYSSINSFSWKNPGFFEEFFLYFHRRDPNFALMLFWDWTYSDNLYHQRFFPEHLWFYLLVSVSSRLDTTLLERLLVIRRSQLMMKQRQRQQQTSMRSSSSSNIPATLTNKECKGIMIEFFKTFRISPTRRALHILENQLYVNKESTSSTDMQGDKKQEQGQEEEGGGQYLDMEIYEMYFRHIAKSYHNRTNYILIVLARTFPYELKTSIINTLLASLINKFDKPQRSGWTFFLSCWNLFDDDDNHNRHNNDKEQSKRKRGEIILLQNLQKTREKREINRQQRFSPDGCSYACGIYGSIRMGNFNLAIKLWNDAMDRNLLPFIKTEVVSFLIEELADNKKEDMAIKMASQWQQQKDEQSPSSSSPSSASPPWLFQSVSQQIVSKSSSFAQDPQKNVHHRLCTTKRIVWLIGRDILDFDDHTEFRRLL